MFEKNKSSFPRVSSNLLNNFFAFPELIIVFLLIESSLLMFTGCGTNESIPCDNTHKFSMHMDKPEDELTTGTHEFDVDFVLCSNYYNSSTWLEVSGPLGPNYQNHYSVEYILPNTGTSNSHTYSYMFQTPGQYYVNGALGTINNGVHHTDITTEIYTVNVVGEIQRELKIHELVMNGFNLWPTYDTYNGKNKRDWAFAEGNTIITALTTKSVELVPNFSSEADAQAWVFNQLGHQWPYYEEPIVCAIGNGDEIWAEATAYGVTRFKQIADGRPAICYIFNTRLQNYFRNQPLNLTIATASIGIHELGHTRLEDFDHIGCGGSEANVCIMRKTFQISEVTNPHFCANHENILKQYPYNKIEANK